MAIKVGDKVRIDGWDLRRGLYVRDCVVVKIEGNQAAVEEESITYIQEEKPVTLEGNGNPTTVPLAYLEIPFAKRWQRNIDDARLIAKALIDPTT